MPLYRAATWPGPLYAAGTYPLARIHGSAAAVSAAATLYLRRFRVRAPVVPASFGVRTQTGGVGSSVKIGVWAAAGIVPAGLPIMSNNTGDATATNNTDDQLAVTGVQLSPYADYFFGAVFTGTLPNVVMCANTDLDFAEFIGVFSASAGSAVVTGYSIAQTYANDIAALDLTGASLTNVTSNATPLPVMVVA